MLRTIIQLLDDARKLLPSVPRWAAAAPGRVNLIGEHIDYNLGPVLPIAIDRWCVAAAIESPDQRWHITSSNGLTTFFDPPNVSTTPNSADFGTLRGYARGVVTHLTRKGVQLRPLQIAIASSVPLGAGLSSSASLEVALARTSLAAAGVDLPRKDIALVCQAAERDFAGVNCGLMDQTASLEGRAGHAILFDCGTGDITPVPLPPNADILVINTNAKHSLVDSPYAQRRAWCESTAQTLGLPSLRALADSADALPTLERRRTSLSPDEYRAARHVVTEIRRTFDAAASLRAGDLARVGELMNQSHESLRHDYRVSCDELDAAVDTARKIPGVYGARMTGGGFGGCAIVLCAPESTAKVSSAISAEFSSRFTTTPDSFQIRAVDGASALRTF